MGPIMKRSNILYVHILLATLLFPNIAIGAAKAPEINQESHTTPQPDDLTKLASRLLYHLVSLEALHEHLAFMKNKHITFDNKYKNHPTRYVEALSHDSRLNFSQQQSATINKDFVPDFIRDKLGETGKLNFRASLENAEFPLTNKNLSLPQPYDFEEENELMKELKSLPTDQRNHVSDLVYQNLPIIYQAKQFITPTLIEETKKALKALEVPSSITTMAQRKSFIDEELRKFVEIKFKQSLRENSTRMPIIQNFLINYFSEEIATKSLSSEPNSTYDHGVKGHRVLPYPEEIATRTKTSNATPAYDQGVGKVILNLPGDAPTPTPAPTPSLWERAKGFFSTAAPAAIKPATH